MELETSLNGPIVRTGPNSVDDEDEISPPETESINFVPNSTPIPKKEKYWKQLNEALQSTTINGLSQAINKSDRKYQYFWISVFIIGVIAFSVNMYTITSKFIKFPILTQLEREGQPFTWPDFTFCSPANPIPFWTNKTLAKKWKQLLKKAETSYPTLRYDDRHGRKIWENYITMSTINPMEFYRYIVRSSINSMAILYDEPSIAAYSSNADSYRGIQHFERLFDIKLYTIRSPIACFTLVPERLRLLMPELKKPDQTIKGIKLYTLMDVKSYMEFNVGFESRKMYFYVTNPNSTIASRFPYYILPGTDSSFRIKEKIHKRVSDCTKKTFTFSLYDINMSGTWRLRGGFEDCRLYVSQEKFVQNCLCYNPYLPIFKFPNTKPTICSNMTLFSNEQMPMNIICLNFVLNSNRHSKSFKREINKRCGEYKKKPCKEYSYSVLRYTSTWQDVVSQSRRQSMEANIQRLKNFKLNDKVKNFLKENLAIIRLEWSGESTEATFEEYEYPFGQYMSDFGGIIGLWIGLSVISLFEFIEIIHKLVQYARA